MVLAGMLTFPAGIDARMLHQRQGSGLDDHVIDRNLDPIGGRLIEGFTGRQQWIKADFHIKEEMRGLLPGLL